MYIYYYNSILPLENPSPSASTFLHLPYKDYRKNTLCHGSCVYVIILVIVLYYSAVDRHCQNFTIFKLQIKPTALNIIYCIATIPGSLSPDEVLANLSQLLHLTEYTMCLFATIFSLSQNELDSLRWCASWNIIVILCVFSVCGELTLPQQGVFGLECTSVLTVTHHRFIWVTLKHLY